MLLINYLINIKKKKRERTTHVAQWSAIVPREWDSGSPTVGPTATCINAWPTVTSVQHIPNIKCHAFLGFMQQQQRQFKGILNPSQRDPRPVACPPGIPPQPITGLLPQPTYKPYATVKNENDEKKLGSATIPCVYHFLTEKTSRSKP